MNIIVYKSRINLDNSKNNVCLTNVNFDQDSKQIMGFCVIQLHKVSDKNFEIIKYDTAHGQCHVHRYYEYLDHEGDLLLDNRICAASMREFKNDIKQNWQEYLCIYRNKHFKHRF